MLGTGTDMNISKKNPKKPSGGKTEGEVEEGIEGINGNGENKIKNTFSCTAYKAFLHINSTLFLTMNQVYILGK